MLPNDVADNYRTYAFRQFKKELTHLSRLHWIFQFGVRSVCQSLDVGNVSNGDHLTTMLPVSGFESKRLNISAGEFRNGSDRYIEHLRVLLLVKACANMEGYIHRIAHIWAARNGYFDGKAASGIDVRGRALIKPAMVSNLKGSLEYLQTLLGGNFGADLAVCTEAYQLRCIAAHNGGVVDRESAKAFPQFGSVIGEPVRLGWSELKQYLRAISAVSNEIERAIPSRHRVHGEVALIATELVKFREIQPDDVDGVREILKSRMKFHRLPGRSFIAGVMGTKR